MSGVQPARARASQRGGHPNPYRDSQNGSAARLVIVSNRVPLPSERGPQAGGLAVALAEILRPGSLWFGWSGRRAAARGVEPRRQVAAGRTYATIDLSEAEYRSFYVNFANGALWPLLHFRLDLLNFRREDYEGYRNVNCRFAEALAPLLRDDDLIWVHDYHLIPLAEELRRLGVRNRIGFFLHTPFVPPELLRALPRGIELLRALCFYDVVGFHIGAYRHAFLECVREMMEIGAHVDGSFVYAGRHVRAIIDPIGINPSSFADTAASAVQGGAANRLRESLFGRALVIGVDRLDYTKGLVNRFEAFGRMLSKYPQHKRHVSFLQVAARSREDARDYQRLRRELDHIVGNTNGRYSEIDWTPLRYVTHAVRRETLAGFYRIARLALVTPLRDGMNLVAKEFVAAQDPANPGVLIVSQFAGAAEELSDALIINPFDADATADAMHEGLSMSITERRRRYRALRKRVWETTASRYCATFLSCLEQQVATTPHLHTTPRLHTALLPALQAVS
jgi:trehalose 6-phosphate synthase